VNAHQGQNACYLTGRIQRDQSRRDVAVTTCQHIRPSAQMIGVERSLFRDEAVICGKIERASNLYHLPLCEGFGEIYAKIHENLTLSYGKI
jgi:hypothetical protein